MSINQPFTVLKGHPMNIEKIAERFCSAPLPESVCADPCATKQGPGRSGTNLLSYIEALHVMKYVLEEQPVDFKDRLIQERNELEDRLTKMKAFFDTDTFLHSIPQDHQVLLYSQSGLMQGYLNTLNKRIDLIFNPKQ